MKPNDSALFASRLSELKNRIKESCEKYRVDQTNIKILAVSKKKSVDDVKIAIFHGLKNFGENYLNEAIEKKDTVNIHSGDEAIEWHYIGAIQKNKTRKIAENFNWVHSVDRFEVAQRLSDQRPPNMQPLKIFLQVNVDHEQNKSGVIVEEAKSLAIAISKLPKLILYGLMTIPVASKLITDQKKPFSKLKKLKIEINNSHEMEVKLKSLSMGMSSDLEAAISQTDSDTETWLRIGTSLFGERN